MNDCIGGKVIVITGASGNVGRELAKELANEGAVLVLQYNKSKDVIDETMASARFKDKVYAVRCDFRKIDEVHGFIRYVKESFKEVNVLINAVGVYDETPLDELTYESIIDVLNVNLISVILINKELGSLMKERSGGVIINFSCLTALRGHKVYGCLRPSLPYVISKAGLINMTKYLANELAPKVRVITVVPGWIRSRKLSPNLIKCIEESVPLGRPADVYELTSLIKFLICEGTYINGSLIEFSGGL